MSHFPPFSITAFLRSRSAKRSWLALMLAAVMSAAGALAAGRARTAAATAQLNSATERLGALTHVTLGDDLHRAAVAWGYVERLRLALEPPFRLVELASRDPRLRADERRTVALGLLAQITGGQMPDVDPAVFDGLGPSAGGAAVVGEKHLDLITSVVRNAEDPRAAELAIRFGYTLAAAERVVDDAAPLLAAQAAAIIADREIARREALGLLRTARHDPLDEIRARRAHHSFYVERPVLLTPGADLERDAVDMTSAVLDHLRNLARDAATGPEVVAPTDTSAATLANLLYRVGEKALPEAPLAVTVQRYLPLVRAQAPSLRPAKVSRARNAEMLAAAVQPRPSSRAQRQAVGRMVLAAGVAMRTAAQEPVWLPGDPAPSVAEATAKLGAASIAFDADVPAAWRPYFLRTLVASVAELRLVLPELSLGALHLRLRMTPPADSALAMHDPRTRTLHLPVLSAAGTLTHELAHDLDRASAVQQGHGGYRSDFVSRAAFPLDGSNRLAASLRALTEELTGTPRAPRARADRPAEIFATRVDWFVAHALAREGLSSGFLSAVQDELLTGHVVHPERLNGSGRSRSLLTALEEMTTVSALGLADPDPSVESLLRWSLTGPVDGREAGAIVRGERATWSAGQLIGERVCEDDETGRVRLIRMAAESRARGWLRQRAEWSPKGDRPAWAHSVLGEAPWSEALAGTRTAELRDLILVELASSEALPAGLGAYATPLAVRARCN